MPFPAYSLGLLIDIGCGNGSYLARMKDLGWKVLGIEPDPASAQIAKNKGIPVFSGSLEEAHLPEAIADYITMTHVIEHLPDPRSTLRECYRLLKPGGKVVVFTPNVDSLGHRLFRQAWMALDPPRHLMIFSVLSIDKLFRTVFSRVDVGTSSHFAREHYDASAVISQSGRVNLHRVRPQRGGLLFAVKERLSCRLWNTGGEELKVVAVK
ncbi:MAG TPA: class I SAM-dependent methyltransferase [Nitrospiria bacterium]|nr:class I SAM-dependent methyltransferase [Nitrospiria bacterium]